MKITLFNTPVGDVTCTSFSEAEIQSVRCTENIRVKISDQEGDLFFDFNPNKEGFTTALTKTREILTNHIRLDV